MKIHREEIELQSLGTRPTFHLVTNAVREIVQRSGVQNGLCTVSTHHTTCAVMQQECSFDETYTGLEFLQQDLLDVFEALVPTCRKEGQYMHPGPKLTEFSAQHGEAKPQTLNTDAHLRSAIMGRSVTLQLVHGALDLGSFGHVYFIDFDQTCARSRVLAVQVLGQP